MDCSLTGSFLSMGFPRQEYWSGNKRDTDFWTMWEKARVGRYDRIVLKHIYYHM